MTELRENLKNKIRTQENVATRTQYPSIETESTQSFKF
jgi:hypothetical protein